MEQSADMENALTLEAPPTMFDEFEAILKQSDCTLTLLSSNSVTRGIRRLDTACYSVLLGNSCVELWLERRVGNPTMFISIVPTRKSISHRDQPSDKLTERVVELLVSRGAWVE